MPKEAMYTALNDIKADFNSIYTNKDPRTYFQVLGQLDYIIPHLAQPLFEQLILARAELQQEPVTVLDLGCSYGLNGALMKYSLDYEALRERYMSPTLQCLSSEDMLQLDRAYYRAWPRHPRVRVIGLDVAENAVYYAEQCGAVDVGLTLDLEKNESDPAAAAVLTQVDLIVSTGCVGYVTSRTFERLAKLARHGRPAWVASFVLRMFPYDAIARTLEKQGLVTERFEGATFVQRRFVSVDEMQSTIRAVGARGLDTRGRESEGLFHADLFISRPPSEIERLPIQNLVSVVSGANKPWRVGTNVLGGMARTAMARRARVSVVRGS